MQTSLILKPFASKDLAMDILLAVIYLFMVVPVDNLKILQMYDSLKKKCSAKFFTVILFVTLSFMWLIIF